MAAAAPAPLRAALAACGGIAPLTLDAARRSPDLEVVALQDPRAEALAAVGERYGITRRHRDFQDLLTDDVDLVIINSPNHLHLEQVRLASQAGKHCLVQKPMAPTAREGRLMVALTQGHGVKLGVTMFELGKPLHHQVRDLVQSGWLGVPTLLQSTSAHTIYLRDPPPEDDWRRNPDQVGGAAFIQLAIHHLNLATWILGREITRVCVAGTSGQTVFADETTLAQVAFGEGGPLGQVAASYAADLYGFTLCGTRGRISLFPEHIVIRGEELFAGEVFAYTEPGEEVVIPLAVLQDQVAGLQDRVEVHGAFARWVRDGGAHYCTGNRGLVDLQVVEAAYRSLREGTWITLD
jgi:predicted dehydrogenase